MTKLRLYYWLGVSACGQKTTGSQFAYSSLQLQRKMEHKGIRLQKSIAKPIPFFRHIKHSVNDRQITIFTQQLAVMLDAGLPISTAMQQLNDSSTRQGVSALIDELTFQVQQGHSLSIAMQDFTYFDALYLQFVRIGESNGDLAQALNYCAEHREKSHQLIKQIKSALIYPLSVLIIACIVMIIMMIFVVPQFSSLFRSFGAELPALTQFTLDASQWFQAHIGTILIATAMLGMCVHILIRKSLTVRHRCAQLLLKLPILGQCILVGELARFNLLLCNGLQAGLPLLSCLDNAIGAIHNPFLKHKLSGIHHRIRSGSSFSLALSSASILPPLMLKMLNIGELTGRLAFMTEKLARLFEQQLNDSTKKIAQLIEPLMIVFLGSLVGGLVLSMYLPIFSLMNAVG
ncbi:type II secretion system F family protein [Vibrio ezurae]|uniref:Type 4 pilus assembly protein PilC n=1 Tax=Vibrio ezurae NBRC 102218 TaxID=1219080 RepID=U3AXP8_9VIBR|nr:type II secretion system F family protein [Vibrio ezurae]GAD78520.1 type 4 pilus assembly protein PilC [Vibrio ezurae NBRC 102218]